MRVGLKWIRELVDLPSAITSQQIADALTMAGLEVEYCGPAESVTEEVIEINVTPNRPDALSYMGIAREVAAIFQVRLRFSGASCSELGPHVHDAAQVSILAKNACLRYACRVIEGVTVSESPEGIKNRLLASGMRPVNNVVDITNVVMLERGQPLHAFDWDRLSKERGRACVEVRFAKDNENLLTIDGVARKLNTEDLVVADRHGPIALAGVMGSKDSEVFEKTTTVFLESAYFVPGFVRRMARRQGLSTDASYRFERGTDPNGVIAALDQAADMIAKLTGGRVRRDVIDIYPEKVEPLDIAVRKSKIAEISGIPEAAIDESHVRNLFLSLGMETVGRRGDALICRVPTFRPDITREIDLIEEALRLIGYDKVPERVVFSKRSITNSKDLNRAEIIERMKAAMQRSGFYEALNFSFGDKEEYVDFQLEHSPELIEVKNPLGEKLGYMRQSLLPALLQNTIVNLRQNQENVRLFEVGTVFGRRREEGRAPHRQLLPDNSAADAFVEEGIRIAGVGIGMEGVLACDRALQSFDFFDMKGVLYGMFASLGLAFEEWKGVIQIKRPLKIPHFLHPGICGEIFLQETSLGHMGQLHPDLKKKYDIKNELCLFEIDVVQLTEDLPQREIVQPLPKFPSIIRDLALLVDVAVTAKEVIDSIAGFEQLRPLLEDVRLFDVYQGGKLPEGQKSMAFSLTLRSLERTLTDIEVADLMETLLKRLESEFGAKVR